MCLFDKGEIKESLNLLKIILDSYPNTYLEIDTKAFAQSQIDSKMNKILSDVRQIKSKHQYEEAIKTINLVLSVNSKHIEAILEKSYVLFRLKKYEETIQTIDSILSTQPSNFEALFLKMDSLNNLKRFEESIEALNKIIPKYPDQDDYYYLLGVAKEGLGQYKEAIEYFNKIEDEIPYEVKKYDKIGLCLHKMGNFKEAITNFDTALENCVEPFQNMDADVLIHKCHSLLKLNKKTTALKILNKVLEMEPENQIALKIKKMIEE